MRIVFVLVCIFITYVIALNKRAEYEGIDGDPYKLYNWEYTLYTNSKKFGINVGHTIVIAQPLDDDDKPIEPKMTKVSYSMICEGCARRMELVLLNNEKRIKISARLTNNNELSDRYTKLESFKSFNKYSGSDIDKVLKQANDKAFDTGKSYVLYGIGGKNCQQFANNLKKEIKKNLP